MGENILRTKNFIVNWILKPDKEYCTFLAQYSCKNSK